RTNLDGMRSAPAFEQIVPLRPRFDELAVAIDDDNAVVKFRELPGRLGQLPVPDAKRAPIAGEIPGQIGRQLDFAAIRQEHAVRRFGEYAPLRAPDVPRPKVWMRP